MRKIVLTIVLLVFPSACFAETIVLKSGKTIEGKIIENSNDYVKVNFKGVPLTFFKEEIDHIYKEANGEIPNATSFAKKLNQADSWAREHHGLIFYQDYASDSYSLRKLGSMAKELGTGVVKTWLKGERPGEIPQKVKSENYRYLFDNFDVVALNVCPDYILHRWDIGQGYDAQTQLDVQQDFYTLTQFLVESYGGQKKIFLISYFFEVNVYMGTPSSGRPEFPVLKFINDAQSSVKRALREGSSGNLKIYDVFESNMDHDCFHFVKDVFPLIKTDLYSVTFYGSSGPKALKSMLNYWAGHAPDNSIFGSQNVIVGEYGIKLEDGRINHDELKQANYLEEVQKEARKYGVPYIFLFWLADQESKVNHEGQFGLIDLKGLRRKAWHDLHAMYQNEMKEE